MEYTSNESGRYTSGSKAHNESYTEVIRDENGEVINNDGLMLQEMDDNVAQVKVELSAYKEKEIVTKVLDRDDQLNMLALIIEQIGTHAGLDTAEFTLAKQKFAEIQAILAKTEV